MAKTYLSDKDEFFIIGAFANFWILKVFVLEYGKVSIKALK